MDNINYSQYLIGIITEEKLLNEKVRVPLKARLKSSFKRAGIGAVESAKGGIIGAIGGFIGGAIGGLALDIEDKIESFVELLKKAKKKGDIKKIEEIKTELKKLSKKRDSNIEKMEKELIEDIKEKQEVLTIIKKEKRFDFSTLA